MTDIQITAQAQNAYSNAWWNAPSINNWGFYPDPQGNFPKPDVNFILPANTPLPAILPGTVTDIRFGSIPVYGGVVTVKLDQPINDLATHYALLHLQRAQPGLQVGSHVRIGDILAYGGANQTSGSAPAAVGFALYPGDAYGLGQEWTRYIQTPNHIIDSRLNPNGVLAAAQGIGGAIPYTSQFGIGGAGSGASTTARDFFATPIYPLIAPSDSVAIALTRIDEHMALYNPVNPNGFDVGYFFNTIWDDAGSLIFRGFIVGLGVYISFQVINSSIRGGASRGLAGLFKGSASTINSIAPEIQ